MSGRQAGLAAVELSLAGRLLGVSAALRPGEVTAICGPNGAGKSTLLQCLAGLLAPDGGAVTLEGVPIASLPPRERARAIEQSRERNPDHRFIRQGDRAFAPEDAIALCTRHRSWLEARLAESHAGTTVVITHFAPHRGSIAPAFASHPANPGFIVPLDHLMGRAALWIHGHTHTCFDYAVEGTRVVCNARGYPDETTGFDMVPKAIASTQLVAKDLAIQHLSAFMQAASNPRYAGFTDPYEELSALVANIDGLPNKDAILLPREKAMANQAAIQQQQQQGDPNKLAELQSKERIAQMQMVAEQQNLALRIQGDITVEQYRMKVALIEAATSRELDMAALAVEADKAARSDDTQRFKAVLDAKMSATQQVMAEQNKPSDPHSKFD